jgi:SAM-dependent methyltransferase
LEFISPYHDKDGVTKRVRMGHHRGLVGGMWDEIGRLQFDFVRSRGLAPDMRFLDVGCGCLRGGIHFVEYLEPFHYFGIEMNPALLDAGYRNELQPLGLDRKLPSENLFCSEEFDASGFGVSFDMALALSVFTHLPLRYLKLCLSRLADVVEPGGRFFATFFIALPDEDSFQQIVHTPGGVTTHPDSNPFHFRRDEIELSTGGLPWKLEKLETWNHPRDQWMATFIRMDDLS